MGISWNAPGVCTLFFGDERWEIERTYFAKQCCVIDLFFLSESEKIILLYFHSPAGWDSVKKINILSEHLKNIQADDAFDDHIVKPQLRKVLLEK